MTSCRLTVTITFKNQYPLSGATAAFWLNQNYIINHAAVDLIVILYHFLRTSVRACFPTGKKLALKNIGEIKLLDFSKIGSIWWECFNG